MQEKQILIDYLSQDGFSTENAALYVNSLLKNPEEPTDLKFNSILKLIRFTLDINKNPKTESILIACHSNGGPIATQEEIVLSKIENLNFSPHTVSTLKAMEINTVQELISFSSQELKKYRNLGKKGLKEIEEFKKNYGF